MILTEKEKQALKQARRLKAFRIRNSDNENTFSDIYYHIQHEVNLYNNNEENNQLTKSSVDSAKVWLLRYAKILTNEREINMYGLLGSTKEGEYHRTIEMLMEKTGKSKKEVAMILYFLYDSQYGNTDLKRMADLAIK